jgi:hypothetical protein
MVAASLTVRNWPPEAGVLVVVSFCRNCQVVRLE